MKRKLVRSADAALMSEGMFALGVVVALCVLAFVIV